MKKDKPIVKKYTFAKDEKQKLENIQIGIIASEASRDGLVIYKNVLLESVYKRCGISGDTKKGFEKNITYNLSENVITYTEAPVNKDLLVKK